MAFRILITSTAIQDLDEAYEWYNQKSEGLESKFALDLQESFQKIAIYPEAFAKRYKNVRGKLLKKFPYLVMYEIDYELNVVRILRVFNTYQNPYWD
jgi:plasmid stabilization system protein ParE